MAKKIKKGTKGSAKLFITRSQALKKLQITLQDFRKLCILKGIYPRDPKHKPKGNDKIYFHIKDIKFLANEKLLDKFREIRSHLRKIQQAKDKGDKTEAKRLQQNPPAYSLAHLVKERYPTLTEALKDLDDALSLINLFATFPTHQKLGISTEIISNCAKLAKEFEVFVVMSKSLRKTFLSIKGIYYQCEINGLPITWMKPYQFSQRLTFEVDYSIMLSFIEFYQAHVKFVLYKLYNDLGIAYPPTFLNEVGNYTLLEHQADLISLQKQVMEKEKSSINIVKNDNETEEARRLRLSIEDSIKAQSIFKGCKAFLNRETPLESLSFVLLCGSGVLSYDHSGATKEDVSITHEIIDRPTEQIKMINGRDYIQPQWVYDSFNSRLLLPIHEYTAGSKLPPHLSPFVDSNEEGYIPKRLKEIKEMKGEEVSDLKEIEAQEDMKDLKPKDTKEEVESEKEEDENEKEKKETKNKKEIEKIKMELGKTMVTKKGRDILNSMERRKQTKKVEAQKLIEKRKSKLKKE